MNLNGATDEIELPVINDEVYVRNSWTDSVPIVIHGNGPSKVIYMISSILYVFIWYLSYRKV